MKMEAGKVPRFISVEVSGYPDTIVEGVIALLDLIRQMDRRVNDLERERDHLWEAVNGLFSGR